MIHSEEAANEAHRPRRALFSNQGSDENMPASDIVIPEEGMGLLDLLKEAGLTKSNGEGRRLVEQGGISIDDER